MRTAKAFSNLRSQTSVMVSPKFQVVIPKGIRQSMGLKPGMMFEVRDSEDIIELVPLGPRGEVLDSGEVSGGRGRRARSGSGKKSGKGA